jgi:putative tryptophan/tyrosine transport system substrate-binding protein
MFLVGSTTSATVALHKATTTIPIVFAAVSDPVSAGLLTNYAKPGGNITGFTNMDAATSHGKLFDLVKQIAPGIKRGGIIFNPVTAPDGGKFYLPSFEAAARALGEPLILPVRSDAEIESAIAAVSREQGGLVVMSDSFFTGAHLDAIISTTRRNKVPAIYQDRSFATGGGLISYGPDLEDVFRRAAGYVDRIVRGEKPADLPVQTPSKYTLVINLKTAEALGLTVPPALLAAADELIE